MFGFGVLDPRNPAYQCKPPQNQNPFVANKNESAKPTTSVSNGSRYQPADEAVDLSSQNISIDPNFRKNALKHTIILTLICSIPLFTTLWISQEFTNFDISKYWEPCEHQNLIPIEVLKKMRNNYYALDTLMDVIKGSYSCGKNCRIDFDNETSQFLINKTQNLIPEYDELKIELTKQMEIRRKCIEKNIGTKITEILDMYLQIIWCSLIFLAWFIIVPYLFTRFCMIKVEDPKKEKLIKDLINCVQISFIGSCFLAAWQFYISYRALKNLIENPIAFNF